MSQGGLQVTVDLKERQTWPCDQLKELRNEISKPSVIKSSMQALVLMFSGEVTNRVH